MPNVRPGVSARPGSSLAPAIRTVMQLVSQIPAFAHRERKSRPVRAFVGHRGTIGCVKSARIFPQRVSLVVRRHVDFKRVCSCCCLP
ncbi:MAG: Ms4527A family Cys-rich leader peptide [Mycobacterium sp.]